MWNIFKTLKPGKKTIGFSAVIVAGAAIGGPITLHHEGVRLQPYYDSVGVLTWCGGETEVGYKTNFTHKECSDLFLMRYGYYSQRTSLFYNDTAKKIITPQIHAALTDMSYNVGIPTVEKSTMIKKLNEGNALAACDAMLLYKYAGGRDCSKDKGNPKGCYGVWDRRLKMNKLCKEGISNEL